ncbi:WD40 repeat domain-containing protein [Streptomyces olivochromogenes]|uniref:WD40 repeat domain-containing protein n=1 Tax=Streptomyces olivochromogenes TaxID=1963 RepID=UPI0027E497BC|nr:hypothetical protein [Streptomyces olivochromogenes]
MATTDGTLRLWTVTRPAHPRSLSSPVDAAGSVSALAFGPDGHILVAGTTDDTLRLWDVSDPAHPSATGDPLVGHTGAVNSAVLGPGSHTLATGSDDGTARLWDLDADSVIHHICAVTGHALDRAQWRNHLGNLPYQPPCP